MQQSEKIRRPKTQHECYTVYQHCIGWICANWNTAYALLNERDTGFKGDPYAMLKHRGKL